ncbi:hypothetical protein [Pelagerythrobacter aerophilus]|uniref:hypothetical protein n=1 Tax=Pelagerythrobacter aerophilus TaxID=2306995 RepID=UPI001603F363|nr:hypothetical protein [Pelagerythrobacter aerophilus]
MTAVRPFLWALAVIAVAVLNIVEVLPDWTTIAAVLTLPFFAAVTGTRCGRARGEAR